MPSKIIFDCSMRLSLGLMVNIVIKSTNKHEWNHQRDHETKRKSRGGGGRGAMSHSAFKIILLFHCISAMKPKDNLVVVGRELLLLYWQLIFTTRRRENLVVVGGRGSVGCMDNFTTRPREDLVVVEGGSSFKFVLLYSIVILNIGHELMLVVGGDNIIFYLC